MDKKNRIIALIDFSRYTPAMLQLCFKWSEIAEAELVLLHRVAGLIPARATSSQQEMLSKAEEEEARKKLDQFLEDFQKKDSAKVEITHYNIVETVWKMTEDSHYNDFLVAGLKGTNTWKSILLGGVTTHLINELERTIIAVPEQLCTDADGHCNFVPGKVVVMVKDRFALNEQALNNLLDTFSSTIKGVVFVTVLEKGKGTGEDEEMLSRLASKYNDKRQTSYKVFEGDALEEIRDYVQHDDDTILVTQKGTRTLTDRLFREFFIHRLVEDGSMPLVVLPQADD